MTELLDIKAKDKGIGGALSNFAPHAFTIDGVQCASMEGFLQSLKFQDTAEQQRVLYMKAKEAKEYGSKRSWDRYLYWKGTKVDRFSKEYQSLLEKAYRSMLANPNFKQALVDSKRKILLHTIGKTMRKNTVLTWWEFIWILYKLRKDVRRNG